LFSCINKCYNIQVIGNVNKGLINNTTVLGLDLLGSSISKELREGKCRPEMLRVSGCIESRSQDKVSCLQWCGEVKAQLPFWCGTIDVPIGLQRYKRYMHISPSDFHKQADARYPCLISDLAWAGLSSQAVSYHC